jgi:hypothetical protein
MGYYQPDYNNDKYFAADEADKTVDYLIKKSSYWFNLLNANRYIDKLRRSWESYHGSFYSSNYADSHSINFAGETGEIANLAVNHYRNIARHIHTMITSNRPVFQARSINTDYKSQVQTTLANGLLEYYMREKKLEQYLKTAVEYSIVLGTGYIKMEWNATSGKIHDYIDPSEDDIYDFDEEGNALDDKGSKLMPFPVYEGDVEFTNMSPFDVVFDSTKESPMDHDWVLCRSFKNKYDLIAKYPELEDKLLKVKTKSDQYYYRMSLTPLDDTVDIPIYEFFHKRTESMPEGRYILYADDDTILMDTAMPYRSLPVFAIMPSHYLGTSYGYTPMFDLMPIQDAVNSLYSTILTNNNAFGVQSILNPRGNDVRVNQVEEGLNFIEYNPIVGGGASGKPESLQLTRSAPETYEFLQMLVKDMETISGVNSVARGNPESSLKSGTALALVQSQALQFISGLQQSYIMLIENIGTGLIELLQDFAKVPRIAAISGESNKMKMTTFTSDKIDSINRVVVDVGNALSQSTAGRVQMADNMIQMGVVTNPEQYFSVINTGRLETMTEGANNQTLLIKAENERLADGETNVVATAVDKHSLHIREHMNVLADPDLRQDQELSQRVLGHILEHVNLLSTTDPNLLAIIGEQPIGPAAGSPVAPGTVAPEQPVGDGLQAMSEIQSNPEAAGVQSQGQLPNQPSMPIDPATGQPFQGPDQGA